ncbi:hypothetical protein KORDIASMS9_02667 [Kordia sp. SMS9]|uniref:hypothetical protein n=1 Tax=Kordia sp. SMS9 TaxID=2282170 RepID=UPI000E0D6CFD|nr:hypothetical protein [Kordia sp. SMS9]AXG70427.1 hypothetical protein KORDIASMS9_02667 [Kordia sp. SMS9]
MIEFIKSYGIELMTALGGLFAWGYERKKRKADLAAAETQNQKSVIDLYQEALDDLKKRYDEKFIALEVEINLLRKNIELWKGKYRKLKQEFDDYKTQHES